MFGAFTFLTARQRRQFGQTKASLLWTLFPVRQCRIAFSQNLLEKSAIPVPLPLNHIKKRSSLFLAAKANIRCIQRNNELARFRKFATDKKDNGRQFPYDRCHLNPKIDAEKMG